MRINKDLICLLTMKEDNREMKSLLIVAGTGANNIVSNYIGDQFEDCLDYISFSVLLVIPFKFEGERRERALVTARYLQEKTLVFRKFDNEDLFSYFLPLKEAMQYADKEIGRLLEEVLFNHKKLCYERR